MSRRLKGITLEINGDTTGLDKALSGVEKNAKKAQSELSDINKLLKLNPNDAELVGQKMQVLGDAVQAAETKLSSLRQAQQQVQAQFDKGDIGADQYRAFMREIHDTESSLANYKTQLSSVQAEQTNLANSTQKLQRFLNESGKSVDDFADVLGTKLVNAIKDGRASSQQLETAFEQINQAISDAQSGFAQYETSMRKLEDASKRIRQEMQLEETQLKNTGTETERYEARMRGLAQQQQNLVLQINTTAQQLAKAKAKYGESSQEVQKLETRLLGLRIAQQQLANQTTDTVDALQRLADEQEKISKATKQMERFFDATGKSIDDFANVLGSDLVNAIKEGRATSAQLESAFDKMAQSALGANADLDRLRTSLRTLDNGGSLDDVREDLQDIEQQARQSEQQVGKLSDAFGAMGGIVAGLGIGKAIEGALEASDLDAKIDVTFDVPEEGKQAVRNALAEVKKYGIDGEEALEGIRRQWALNKNATDEMNASIVEGAGAIAKSYSRLDFVELIQEVNEIAGELQVTDDEALNLVNSLLKIGFPDEQLDVIAEYGGQLQRAGFELKEIEGILASAVATDSFNIDVLLDSLKEGRIRAAEFGLGLSESFKNNLRIATNSAKGATDEELNMMQEGFAKQEKALSKSLENKEKAISKSHSQQQKALDKALSSESKSLDKALNAQQKALEKAHAKKLKLLDAEYMAKLKVIDEERYNAIKAIEDEIKALEGLTDAEDKASKAKEDAEKRATLASNVENAKTKKNRELAIAELAQYDEEMRVKAMQDQRKERIEELKDEKDKVGDAFDVRKDSLKDEYDLKKEQLKEIQDDEKDALDAQQTRQREALQERHAMQKEMLQERLSLEADAVREAHASELESFKKMNAQKLELAKNPPDNAQFKAVEQQLENWGKAIAKGGEEGSKAFRDMIAWLDGMEDGALKNAIGVEILGTKYEDQGQKIIDTLMNSTTAMDEMAKSATKVSDSTDRMNDGNAMVSVADAFEKMRVALEPLLFAIAKVIDVLATLMGKFPVLSSIIVAFLGVIAMIASAMTFLMPLIANFGLVFSKIGPIITFIGGLLSTLAGAILPALGAAFAFLTSPIGLVIVAVMALIGIVALIIKFWDPISEFFKNLWSGIVDIFTSAFNFIGEHWKTLLAIITGPFGLIILAISKFGDQIKDFFSKMWESTVGIFRSAGQWLGDAVNSMFDLIMTPTRKLQDAFIGVFQYIKNILPSIWDGIVTIIKTPLNFLIKLLNSFIGGINKIKVPDWIPGVGGMGISIPEIPMLAKGTNYFKGGAAIVGERGAELVELPRGSKVHPNDKTMDMLGGGGININVSQLQVREEADVNKVARQLYALYDKERRGR